MYDNFMTPDVLGTFTGLVVATSIIVQFTKSFIKKGFGDGAVRFYTFIISLILTFVFAKSGSGVQGVILTLINAILISFAAMGGYEVVSNPRAEKQKIK